MNHSLVVQSAVTAGLVLVSIGAYELVRQHFAAKRRVSAQSRSRANPKRKKKKARARVIRESRKMSVDIGDSDTDGSDVDEMTVDEASTVVEHLPRIGKDGRPTTGLVREKLVVQENRMSDAAINTYLSTLLDHLKERTKHHLGYPYNLSFQSNNLVPFAKLYDIPLDQYWGYVTCSGTEGNLLGVLYGREKFKPERNGVLYCSRDTHYSVPKACAMYRIDLELVDSDDTGEMVYADLERKMRKHLDRPMIINVNVGTTVKGASDTVDEVVAVLKKLGVKRDKFYIHVDGALSGVVLPFVSSRCENKRVTFTKPIDSVSVSGHKMLGTPMPSGVVITRSEHSKRWGSDIEYLNSTDTTIMGSRNGQAAIAMWVALQRKGVDGLRSDVVQCHGACLFAYVCARANAGLAPPAERAQEEAAPVPRRRARGAQGSGPGPNASARGQRLAAVFRGWLGRHCPRGRVVPLSILFVLPHHTWHSKKRRERGDAIAALELLDVGRC